MHRSGTSALTNILSKAGYFVSEPKDMMHSTKDNPMGHFERWSVARLNNEVLSACGGSWDDPPDSGLIEKIKRDVVVSRITEVYSDKEHSVIKDPRMCLTFPVWERVLGNELPIVYISRDITSVAASLQTRNGMSLSDGKQLWKTYTLRAVNYMQGHPSFSLKYEELFTEARPRVLEALADFLSLDVDLAAIAKVVVDPAFRHHGS